MKKILYKKLEKEIFTKTEIETIISYYAFFINHFLERFDIKDINTHLIIKKELSVSLEKAIVLYKENKNYEKEYSFFTYCTYFFAEVINKYIESHPDEIIKLQVLDLEEFD